jgi:hypothetical protein
LPIFPKIVIQGLSADFATRARFSVLSPEHDDAGIENIFLVRRRKPEITLFGHSHLFREQPRHPARRKSCREDQTQRRPRAIRDEHALLYQRRDDAACLALARSHHARRVGPRQFPAIEHGFENAPRFGRQMPEPSFLFRPQKDAYAQTIRLDQALHECDLIDAHE